MHGDGKAFSQFVQWLCTANCTFLGIIFPCYSIAALIQFQLNICYYWHQSYITYVPGQCLISTGHIIASMPMGNCLNGFQLTDSAKRYRLYMKTHRFGLFGTRFYIDLINVIRLWQRFLARVSFNIWQSFNAVFHCEPPASRCWLIHLTEHLQSCLACPRNIKYEQMGKLLSFLFLE